MEKEKKEAKQTPKDKQLAGVNQEIAKVENYFKQLSSQIILIKAQRDTVRESLEGLTKRRAEIALNMAKEIKPPISSAADKK